MLSREKQSSNNIKIQRNQTLALTYDMQNSSTKLLMLNLSNINENRIRTTFNNRCNSTMAKDFKCCICLTRSDAPACACIHRDKDLSKPRTSPYRDKDSFKPPLVTLYKTKSSTEKLPLWPSLTKDEMNSLEKRNNRYKPRENSHRYVNRDSWLMSSIPALRHPDFSPGQRQYLLSMAKIYTNVAPSIRKFPQYPENSRSASSFNKKNNEKIRSKNVKKINFTKGKSISNRENNLKTAVSIFKEDQTDEIRAKHCNKNKNNKMSFNDPFDNEENFNEDMDVVINDYVIGILFEQAKQLSNEKRIQKYEESIFSLTPVNRDSLQETPNNQESNSNRSGPIESLFEESNLSANGLSSMEGDKNVIKDNEDLTSSILNMSKEVIMNESSTNKDHNIKIKSVDPINDEYLNETKEKPLISSKVIQVQDTCSSNNMSYAIEKTDPIYRVDHKSPQLDGGKNSIDNLDPSNIIYKEINNKDDESINPLRILSEQLRQSISAPHAHINNKNDL